MEVNIIFQNESEIDENNNFHIEFKNEQEIIELFLARKEIIILQMLSLTLTKR